MSTGRVWVNSAFPCQNVLQETNGSVSFIRVLDTITINHTADEIFVENGVRKLLEANHLAAPFDFVLAVSRDGDVERFGFDITLIGPSGIRNDVSSDSMVFGDEQFRAVFILRLNVVLQTEGMASIEVRSNGEIISRFPFRIMFNETSSGDDAAISAQASSEASPEDHLPH